MDVLTPKALFLQSVNRCVAAEGFAAAFCARFFGSFDEIKSEVELTDLMQQIRTLSHSLQLCANAATGEADPLTEITARAMSHRRSRENTQPRLFENWLDAFMATAAEFDPEWSGTVEAAWRRILGNVVQQMNDRN